MIALLGAAAHPPRAAEIELAYTSDILHNSRGGLERATQLLGKADLIAGMDLPALSSAVFLHAQYTHGGGFSQRIGDLQTVSNIDAPTGARIMEIWLQQAFGEQATLKAGLYDLNSEFDAIETGGLFIGSSHGVGPDISQSGGNGPSIFPTTSLGLRGEKRFQNGLALRAVVLDAVPGDADHPGRTTVQLGDGVLGVIEADLERSGRRAGLGAWRYSRKVSTFTPGAQERKGYERGIYGFVEAPLPSEKERGWATFLRVGIANADVEQIGWYAGAGVVARNVILHPFDNSLGLAIASARTGRPYRNLQASLGESSAQHETAIELAWEIRVNDWIVLQPDIQYVLNPGTSPSTDDALILGLRWSVAAGGSF